MRNLVELPSGILVPNTEFIPEEENKFKPTLHEIRDISLILAEEIKYSGIPVTKVVGVSRGGITPMDPFTRTLEIQDTDVFAVAFYTPNPRRHEEGQNPEVVREEPLIFHEPIFGPENEDGHGVLFVEDLTDTGKTGRLIRANWPRALTVALYIKETEEEALEYVDFYGQQTGKVWIDNPWEIEQRLGYSPVRVLDSIRWAREGRPKLIEEMDERRKLLQRPELIERLAA